MNNLLKIREEMEKRKVVKSENGKKEENDQGELDDLFQSILDAAENSENRNDNQNSVKSEQKPEIKISANVVKLTKSVTVSVKPDKELRVKRFESNKIKNIFRFSFGAKRLARTGGHLSCARGFNYGSKTQKSRDVWPYPAPKPSFHVWWKYILSNCGDVYTLAYLFSTLVRLLKWDLVNERPSYVEGDKLLWTEKSDEEHIHYELKSKRFIPGSGNLRVEYEIKQEIVQIESDEGNIYNFQGNVKIYRSPRK